MSKRPQFTSFQDAMQSALRAATAVQVAVYELADEDVSGTVAGAALDECLAKLTVAVKALRREF